MKKIVECCKELLNNTNIGFSNEYSVLGKGKVCYWTGEEKYATDIEIMYCPFCGKKIEVEE